MYPYPVLHLLVSLLLRGQLHDLGEIVILYLLGVSVKRLEELRGSFPGDPEVTLGIHGALKGLPRWY